MSLRIDIMKKLKLAQSALSAFIFTTSAMLSSASVVFAAEQLSERPTSVNQQSTQQVQVAATKVNINLANFDQLVSLPGIGKVKAQAIINYRKDVGVFKSVEDIQNIKGIGVKLFGRLVNMISI